VGAAPAGTATLKYAAFEATSGLAKNEFPLGFGSTAFSTFQPIGKLRETFLICAAAPKILTAIQF